ncbi:MAG: RnfH family protein [Woeseiaceae bacterium]|jgi:putative ubiquitin-RnfH superfamily antitoxin RatB of RatAB toxin-antitoxin module|nr:RnfH family protein [Woeseiaceae bacterium]
MRLPNEPRLFTVPDHTTAGSLNIEAVFALSDRQQLVPLVLDAGATVADALHASGFRQAFPDADFKNLQSGIWGRIVSQSQLLQDGDRVEFYRALERDPREARRELAKAQRLGSSS